MLTDVVKIILSSEYKVSSGTLFCNGINISNKNCVQVIDFLESEGILENTNYENTIGQIVDIELSLARLNSIGFYENCDAVIFKNRYSIPPDTFYVLELKAYNFEKNEFISSYFAVIDLLNSIKSIAKHTYCDVDIENSIIFREDKSILLPLVYDAVSLNKITSDKIEEIKELSSIYKDNNSEKRLLYVNELIEYLLPISESIRFLQLLDNISELNKRCLNAYQYYLRDFSYNKLKIELDSKALEFTQKIQGVINDSQTKLVAIPTAFVLAFANLDFANLISTKNIGTIISLFVFSTIIQLFLNNQKSTLLFIEGNVTSYKETFKNKEIEKNSSKFKLVETEFEKQKKRLLIIQILTWLIPAVLLLGWLFLILKENVAVIKCSC